MPGTQRSTSHPARVARRGPSGMTLMELLAVVAIVSMMLGLSAIGYWRMSKSFREQGAASEIDVCIRQARNSAIAANAPAFVEIDPENRLVRPWAFRTVGLWHFEDRSSYGETRGPFHNARMAGAELFSDGKIGKCARLREGAYVDAGNDPDFDFEDGGYLEAYIRPGSLGFAGDNFIFFKKNAFQLKIGVGGVLVANTVGKTIQTKNYRVVPGRWTKVALTWDRQSTRILVDDGVVAVGPGGKTPLSDYPLLMGHDQASFTGLIDEVRFMTATAGNPIELPKSYGISHTAAPWNGIYFAGNGNLDLRYHAGPVSITLSHETRARTVSVSMLGTTQRLELENIDPKDNPAVVISQNKRLTIYGEDGKPIKSKAEQEDEKNKQLLKGGKP